jgi:hypothetical protein
MSTSSLENGGGHSAGTTASLELAAVTPKDAASLARQTRGIDGWLSPGAIYLFALIDAVQKRNGIAGNLFEIGVHHGKSALVLGAMAQPADRLGVCDVFGAQSLNVSASGKGDREIFLANFRGAFPDDRFLTIHEKLSSALSAEEVTACRFLHVDGGHSSPEALADLELCAQCMVPGAVIAVDDAFHPSWPGVTDAVFRFLARRPEMAPLVIGFNKMLLVEASWRDRYVRVFEDRDDYRRYIPREPYSLKVAEVAGYPTYVFHVHSSRSERSLMTWLHRLRMEYPSLASGPAGTLWRSVRGVRRALRVTR